MVNLILVLILCLNFICFDWDIKKFNVIWNDDVNWFNKFKLLVDVMLELLIILFFIIVLNLWLIILNLFNIKFEDVNMVFLYSCW